MIVTIDDKGNDNNIFAQCQNEVKNFNSISKSQEMKNVEFNQIIFPQIRS